MRGKVEGGHGLKAVCARELGVTLDKSEQTSNWARRPLSDRQRAYAAVDADAIRTHGIALGLDTNVGTVWAQAPGENLKAWVASQPAWKTTP